MDGLRLRSQEPFSLIIAAKRSAARKSDTAETEADDPIFTAGKH